MERPKYPTTDAEASVELTLTARRVESNSAGPSEADDGREPTTGASSGAASDAVRDETAPSDEETIEAGDTLAGTLPGGGGPTPDAASIGRFTIRSELGRGGVGRVLLGHDPELGRDVAIKLLRGRKFQVPATRQRFEREARALAKLSHPNVVQIYEVGYSGEQPFIAMEYVPGGTLKTWQQETHTWREIVTLYIQIARGLAAAHAVGLIHRDFKPENVLVGNDGRPRVADFGLASSAVTEASRSEGLGKLRRTLPSNERTDAFEGVTRGEALMGTPLYMSPEQFDRKPLDPRTDQFSFCVCLWRSLHDMHPFAGDDVFSLASAVSEGAYSRPAGRMRFPARLQRAMERGLSVSPNERWPNMEALIAELEQILRMGRQRMAVAAALVPVFALGISATLVSAAQSQPCADLETSLDGIWDARTQAEIELAFESMDAESGARTWGTLRPMLDRYATRWVREATEVCEATRISGTQSEALMDRRMQCLSRHRTRLAGLTDSLRRPSGIATSFAFEAIERLPAFEPCTAPTLLADATGPHSSTARQTELDRLRSEIDRGTAAIHARRGDEAKDAVRSLIPRIEPLAHADDPEGSSLAAQLEVLQGEISAHERDGTAAREHFENALALATTAGDDAVAFEAWRGQLRTAERSLIPPRDGQAALAQARAWASRLGVSERYAPSFRASDAWLSHLAGDSALAAAKLNELLARRDEDASLDRANTAARLLFLADASAASGDANAALAAATEAVEIRRALFGEHDPATAHAIYQRGRAQLSAGQHQDAERSFESVLSILATTPSKDPLRESNAHVALASIALSRGDIEAARRRTAAAVAAAESASNVDEALAHALALDAVVAYFEDDHEHAAASGRRALELLDDGQPTSDRAQVASNLGESLLALGKTDQARAAFVAALADWQRVAPSSADRAYALKGLGLVALAEGKPNLAIGPLDEALELMPESEPVERLEIELASTLARRASGLAPLADLSLTAKKTLATEAGEARVQQLARSLGPQARTLAMLDLPTVSPATKAPRRTEETETP